MGIPSPDDPTRMDLRWKEHLIAAADKPTLRRGKALKNGYPGGHTNFGQVRCGVAPVLIESAIDYRL
jgi:hypothetical protein